MLSNTLGKESTGSTLFTEKTVTGHDPAPVRSTSNPSNTSP